MSLNFTEDEKIQFSSFRVSEVHFGNGRFPTSLKLESFSSDKNDISNNKKIVVLVNLTELEQVNLARVLNNVAWRVETELKEGLMDNPKTIKQK